MAEQERPKIVFEHYRFRAIEIHAKPGGFRGWTRIIWGADVWLGHVPLMKVTITASVGLSLLATRLVG